LSTHANAAAVRRGFNRFAEGDVVGLLDLFADDAVWHIPGTSPMAGAYEGRDEIVALLRRTAELTGGTYSVNLVWVVADEEHIAAVYSARGERDDGRTLDIEQTLLIGLRDGLWADIRAQPLDQAAFDAFWA
jgi:ketosteroid isomerase-like protein